MADTIISTTPTMNTNDDCNDEQLTHLGDDNSSHSPTTESSILVKSVSNSSLTETVDTESSASCDECEESSLEDADITTLTRSSITFGNVSVRRYSLTVGDHPETRVGPPVTLDWVFDENEEVTTVEQYETVVRSGVEPRRLLASQRRKLLHEEFGISEDDIAKSQKEVQTIRENRIETKKKESKKDKSTKTRMQRLLKSVGKKAKKMLLTPEVTSQYDRRYSGTSLIVPFSY